MKKVYFYRIYGLFVKSEIKFDEYVYDSSCSDEFDLNIIFSEVRSEINDLILKGVNQVVEENEVWFHINNIGTYRITNGNTIMVQPHGVPDVQALKAFLIGTCMGYVFYQKGMLAIHGGTLEKDDKAIIIVGESGSGKSTLSTALRLSGYGLMTDDITRVEMNNGVTVFPGYPAQRLCEDCINEFGIDKNKCTNITIFNKNKYVVPLEKDFVEKEKRLGAIFELSVGDIDCIKTEEVKGNEKLQLLLRNIYSFRGVKHLGVKPEYFIKCLTLAKNIPMFKIMRPRNGFTVNGQIGYINRIMSSYLGY